MQTSPKNLKKVRKNKGYTLKQLADISGLPVSTIGNFETGKFEMSLEKITILSKVLEVTPEELSRPLEKSQDVTYGGDAEAPRPQQYSHVPPGIEGVAKSLHACVVAGDACAALIMLEAIGPPLREAAAKQESDQRQTHPPAAP
jgi:transcriptional regulator with XRE-family HTH domain